MQHMEELFVCGDKVLAKFDEARARTLRVFKAVRVFPGATITYVVCWGSWQALLD